MLCVKCGRERDGKKRCDFCLKEQKKLYRQNNKEKIADGNKVYYENNKQEIRQQRNAYEVNRYKADPSLKLRKNCSNLIRFYLKQGGSTKNGSSILDFLPYTMDELKKHLENQFDDKMSWDNYGRYWHIDHIIPQSKLPFISMEEDNFKKCWNLSNLRPLEATENRKKSNK
jgi:hypothetical protein